MLRAYLILLFWLGMFLAYRAYASEWYTVTLLEGEYQYNHKVKNVLVYESNDNAKDYRITIYNTDTIVKDCDFNRDTQTVYYVYDNQKCKD